MYFLMLPFLVHKIFTYYINGVLNCKHPAPGPKGWTAFQQPVFFPWLESPLVGKGPLTVEASRSQTYHIWRDFFTLMIGPSQRPLPDNTQHSQQTDIHAPGGIQIHNRGKWAAADLRLRPRGYWDQQAGKLYTYAWNTRLIERLSS